MGAASCMLLVSCHGLCLADLVSSLVSAPHQLIMPDLHSRCTHCFTSTMCVTEHGRERETGPVHI